MMLRNGLIIAAEAHALHREYIEDASRLRQACARPRAGGQGHWRGGLCAGAAGARPRLRGLGRMDARRRRAADAVPALRRLPSRRRRRNGDAAGGLHARRQLRQRVRPGAAGGFTADGLPVGVQLLGRPTARPRWAVSAWPSRPPRTGTCAVRISARSGSRRGRSWRRARFAREPLNLRSGHVDAGVRRFADSSLEFSR